MIGQVRAIRVMLAIALLLAWAQLATAQVAIGPVTGQPGVLNVNPDGATTVRLRWRIQLTSAAGGIVTIRSTNGLFGGGGALGGPLVRTVRHPGGGAIFVTLTESLYIDRTTAEQLGAARQGTFTRVFTAGAAGGAATGSVRLQASSGGALSLRNLEISFDDGRRFRTVAPGSPLSARLVVTTSGRGFFAGSWEVAGPTGSSAFRPLGRVNRRLSGARRTVFEAPALPTGRPGLYRVRFVADDVVPGSTRTPIPELSYTVSGERDAGQGSALTLLAPQPGAEISRATRFAWQEVAGAARYKVEFSTEGESGFGADILAAVAVNDTAMRLRPNTLLRLENQQAIFWRVIAFDRAGNPIASSAQRRLR